MSDTATELIQAARALRNAVDTLHFAPPISHVYNPLDYAWDVHQQYLQRYAQGRKRVVFVGMNPGPFGMAQTGVPFGEVAAVRDWLGLHGHVGQPRTTNPQRPVQGFACTRSEVSGQRLWGLFAARFGTPAAFFAEHFVANYCPLVFLEGGRNITPDKLPAAEQRPLLAACDAHLQTLVHTLQPQWVIGVGVWAKKARTQRAAGPSRRPALWPRAAPQPRQPAGQPRLGRRGHARAGGARRVAGGLSGREWPRY